MPIQNKPGFPPPLPPAPYPPAPGNPVPYPPPRPPQGGSVPPPPPGVVQYIGARYVPKFADPLEWQDNTAYEYLTIVTYNGNSYTSRADVPAGVPPTNSSYWAETGNFNAQLDDLSTKIDGWDEQINKNTVDVESALEAAQAAQDAVKDVPDFTALTADVEQLKTDVATNTTGISDNKTAIDDLTTQVNTATDDIADLVAEQAEQDTKIKTNADDISALQTSTGNLDTRVTAAEGKITQITTDIAELDSDYEDHEKRITANASDIAALKEQVGTPATGDDPATGLELAVANNAAGVKTNADAIAVLENTVGKAAEGEDPATGLVGQVADLAGQIQPIKDASDAATAEVERLTGIVGDDSSGLIKDFNDLKEAVESGESVEALAGRVGLLENQVGKAATDTDPATGLVLEIDNLKTGLDTANTNITTVSNKVTDNADAIAALQTSVGDNAQSITELENALGAAATESDPATGVFKELENLQTEITENMGDISALQADVSEAKSQNSAQDTAISGNTTAISNLASKLNGYLPTTGPEGTGLIAIQKNNAGQPTIKYMEEDDDLISSPGKEVRIIGVKTPVDASDAVNKAYVDSKVANVPQGDFLPLSGGTMTGSIKKAANARLIEGLPSASGAEATCFYLSSPNNTVALGIGIASQGNISPGVPLKGIADPTGNNDAANKQYVDNAIASAGAGTYLPLSGGILTGNIKQNNGTGFTANINSILNFWKDTNTDTIFYNVPYPSRLIGTKEGVILSGIETPEQNKDAANKKYVDDKAAGYLPLSGGTVSSPIIQGGNYGILQSANNMKTARFFSTSTGAIFRFDASDNYDGDNDYIKLMGIANPTTNHGAANKAYVDAAVAAISGGANIKIGAYNGSVSASSTTTQTITLGSRPQFVFVIDTTDGIPVSPDTTPTVMMGVTAYINNTVYSYPASGTDWALEVTTTGFRVRNWNASTDTTARYRFNQSAHSYVYLAVM